MCKIMKFVTNLKNRKNYKSKEKDVQIMKKL